MNPPTNIPTPRTDAALFKPCPCGRPECNTVTIQEAAKFARQLERELAEANNMGKFQQGYVCAVAALVAAHGRETEAEYLLDCLGSINWSQIDQHDKAILVKAGLAPDAAMKKTK